MRSLFLAALMLLVACGVQPATGSGGGGGSSNSDAGAGGGSAGGSGGAAGGGSGGGSAGGLGGGSGGSGGGVAGGAGGSAGGGAGGGTGAAGGGGGVGGGTGGGGSIADAGFVDLDLDGLDDAWENQLARDYLPVLAVDPSDACALGGLAFRVFKHPTNPALVSIIYDHLFENDCGLTAHVGDNEAFGITVNPAKPAPQGITALKAISHQNTACQKITECGTCGSLTPCGLQPDGGLRPLIFSSKNKHGGYASLAVCNNVLSCLDACVVSEKTGVPMVNVGEPDAHFNENLSTDGGFINAANGWTKTELFNINPWDLVKKFGNAGSVGEDFIDPAFVASACN